MTIDRAGKRTLFFLINLMTNTGLHAQMRLKPLSYKRRYNGTTDLDDHNYKSSGRSSAERASLAAPPIAVTCSVLPTSFSTARVSAAESKPYSFMR